MATYLLAYRGGGMPETDEERTAVMAAWGAWFEGLGDAVKDGGNPFGPSATIAADSLAEAVGAAKDCPIRTSGGVIEVYETFDVM